MASSTDSPPPREVFHGPRSISASSNRAPLFIVKNGTSRHQSLSPPPTCGSPLSNPECGDVSCRKLYGLSSTDCSNYPKSECYGNFSVPSDSSNTCRHEHFKPPGRKSSFLDRVKAFLTPSGHPTVHSQIIKPSEPFAEDSPEDVVVFNSEAAKGGKSGKKQVSGSSSGRDAGFDVRTSFEPTHMFKEEWEERPYVSHDHVQADGQHKMLYFSLGDGHVRKLLREEAKCRRRLVEEGMTVMRDIGRTYVAMSRSVAAEASAGLLADRHRGK